MIARLLRLARNRASRAERSRAERSRTDAGAALITVMLIGVVLSSVVAVSVSNALSDLNRATSQLRRSTALQAAEAGLANYLAKLTEDHSYYAHFVHPGESTRNDGAGAIVAGGNTWTGAVTWTYPAFPDRWLAVPAIGGSSNGYEYNLQVTAPTSGVPTIKIVATGRKQNSPLEIRRIEADVRPASIADYMMITNKSISYGTAATTRGKVYAGINDAGTAQNVDHQGKAYASVYAEGSVTNTNIGATNMAASQLFDGAKEYDKTSNPTIRQALPSPILFSTFVTSFADVKAAASIAPGILLDDSSVAGWRLTFNANGTITIAKCAKSGGLNIAEAAPRCPAATETVRTVPSNGAIFAEQSVIVRGVVDGQFTVASNGDIVVGENVTYELAGNDVLGLIAQGSIYMAKWATNDLTLNAAVIAKSGSYQSWVSDFSHGTFTHVGAVATNLGGFMTMFNTRNYLYDPNLLFLQPPYYPVVGDAYVVQNYRELIPPVP